MADAAQARSTGDDRDVHYRRYRGDDEVTEDHRGRGRGRGGDDDDRGSRSGAGSSKEQSGGNRAPANKPGKGSRPDSGGNVDDAGDRFGR